jgi:cell division septum initiation protein DivIVA
MNNDIISNTAEIGYWDMISGYVDNSDEIDDLQDRIDDLNWLITADSSKEDDERIQAQIDELQDKIDELTEAQETTPEIFQYYIVSNNGAEILKDAGEIVFYNDVLDMYVWGVTHWGTSWDYVLTDIKIVKE